MNDLILFPKPAEPRTFGRRNRYDQTRALVETRVGTAKLVAHQINAITKT